jgi:hypothetical protein
MLGNLHRRVALAAGLLTLLAAPAVAFELVSPAEALRDRAAAEPPAMRSTPRPGAPTIELLAPEEEKPLKSPMDIRLRWAAEPSAEIDTASVRVRYGRLGIDVTDRVLGSASVTPQGIDAPDAKLPPGEHRLTVEVADSRRRVASRQFVVQVIE